MSEELDLLDYVVMLRRRWWIIVIVVVAGCCSAYGYGRYMQTPVYEASAKLIMTNVDGVESGEPLSAEAIEANLMMLHTYKDIVRTPVVMKKVAVEHPELGMTAGMMGSKISVSSGMTSQVLSISARDTSYQRAAQLVNAVAEVIVEETTVLYGSHNLKVLYGAEVGTGYTPGPVNMSLKTMLVMAFVASFMLAVGICVLLHYLDRKIRSDDDVERTLGLPTLMELPLFVEEKKVRHSGRKASRLSLDRAGEGYHVPFEK